jgi:hypothetical protein
MGKIVGIYNSFVAIIANKHVNSTATTFEHLIEELVGWKVLSRGDDLLAYSTAAN